MFNCNLCHNPIGPSITVTKVVTEKANRIYYNLQYIQKRPDRQVFYKSFKIKLEQEQFIELLRKDNNFEIIKSWETRGGEKKNELK